MDVTNRSIIVGAALVGVSLVFIVILLAWFAPDDSIRWLSDFSGYLDDHNTNAAKAIITLGGLILILMAGLVILYEVAPPETGSVHVARVGSGDARMASDEVAQRLEEEIAGLAHVTGVKAGVAPRGRRAEVRLDLYVTPEADVTMTTDEAIRLARALVEGRMGLELDGQPKAQVHYREQRAARGAPAAPAAAAPTAPAAPTPAPATSGAPTMPSSEQADDSPESREDTPPAGA